MKYRLFEFIAIAFSVYFLYASFKSHPSILGNYLRFFGIKNRKRRLDQIYNGFIGIVLIFLEMNIKV